MASRYRRGDRGAAVAEIRRRLTQLGLLDHSTSTTGELTVELDTFDDALDHAVRSFQQQRGASVDGVVGPQTWRLLDEARWRLGDRVLFFSPSHLLTGDDVVALQRRLLELGFDSGRVDGVFGRQTATALVELQRNTGLTADGTCGPATFEALGRLARTVVGGTPGALREGEVLRRSGPGLAGKAVVLDPGHGGSDPGATGHGLTEAAVAEDLAARIEGRLAAVGVTVYLTRGRLRPDASALDDLARADLANALDADLLVSLHADAQPGSAAHGVATYYFGNRATGAHSTTGEVFAGLVQREICARTDLQDCRTHGKTWELLRRTRMPAVRLEVGYLSHPGDAARLADDSFRDTVAEAVVVAVQRVFLPPEDDAPTGTLRLPDFSTLP